MREVNVALITDTVKRLSIEANYFLGADIKESLEKSKKRRNIRTSRTSS